MASNSDYVLHTYYSSTRSNPLPYPQAIKLSRAQADGLEAAMQGLERALRLDEDHGCSFGVEGPNGSDWEAPQDDFLAGVRSQYTTEQHWYNSGVKIELLNNKNDGLPGELLKQRVTPENMNRLVGAFQSAVKAVEQERAKLHLPDHADSKVLDHAEAHLQDVALATILTNAKKPAARHK